MPSDPDGGDDMTRLIGPLLAAGVLAIAGCGGSNNSSSGSGAASTATPTSTSASTSSSSSSGGGQKLALAADPGGNLKFDKQQLTAKAGTVTIDFTNSSSTPHAVAVEGNGVDKDAKVITGGKTSLTVNLKPGTYDFYCPVDGHRQAGMEGKLIVK
jgi:plastocyanin